MANRLVTTKELTGMRVVRPTKKSVHRVGKVRRFIFHPTEKRVVGFTVKRPDAALMFHRKDLFVPLDGFKIIDGRAVLKNEPQSVDRGAIKRLGLNWDECVLWVGMPLMTKKGDSLGYVGKVTFDRITGEVDKVESDSGIANDAIIGKLVIPSEMIKGFRRGQGVSLAEMGDYGARDDDAERGAILVDEKALLLNTEGGAAEAAGHATAAVADSAKEAVDSVKPVAKKAAKKTGKAVNKGAYSTGKQVGKAKHMFSNFKEEYNKASK